MTNYMFGKDTLSLGYPGVTSIWEGCHDYISRIYHSSNGSKSIMIASRLNNFYHIS